MLLRRTLLGALALLLAAAPAASGAVRPDQPGAGVYGQPGWSEPEAAKSPYCTPHACIHWVDTTGDAPNDLSDPDGDGVPESIEYAGEGVERSFRTMVDGLGWRRPLGDGALGGGTDLVDVYVKDLDGRAAGVASVDSRQNAPSQAPKRYHGFIILDEDYLGSWGFIQRKLVPHEVQHLIEYAYDAWFESWNGESTAEWSVTRSDRSFAFFFGYPSAWGQATELPMLDVRDAEYRYPPPKAYISLVWQRWFERRHGPAAIREIWERAADDAPSSFFPNLVDEQLAGTSTFFDEFVAFAVDHAEWRAAGGAFGTDPGTYEVERVGTLRPGAAAVESTLDHTTFALHDVPVSDAAAYELRASAPEGTSAAIALVGRTGDAATGGVEVQVQRLPDGGEAKVGFSDPGRFQRITAVLVNADTKLADPPKTPQYEWVYAGDDQRFTAAVVRTDRPPAPPAEVPSPVAPDPLPESAGAPPERPPTIGDDLVAPTLVLAPLPRRALRRLRAGRAVAVHTSVDEPSALDLQLRAGTTVVGGKRVARRAAGAGTVTLRLGARARRRLERSPRGRAISLVVTARDAAGNARVVRRRLR